MDARLRKTRKYLEGIPTKAEYMQIMDKAKLTDIEREVMDLRYLKGKTLIFIGEEIGYSENTIKKYHHNALRKLDQLL